MNPTDIHEPAKVHALEDRKPFSPPGARRLTPDAARELLLRHCDASDPEIKFMLACIEQLKSNSDHEE